jgi:hypothetical protein
MSSRAAIITDITGKVLTGGRRTKAKSVREILTDIVNSFANYTDGSVSASKVNAGQVIDEDYTYFLSNGASGESPGPRFFKLVLDDFGQSSFELVHNGDEV